MMRRSGAENDRHAATLILIAENGGPTMPRIGAMKAHHGVRELNQDHKEPRVDFFVGT
jgi:hypothetical protein